MGATLLFIAGFSLGMGPVGWIVLAEIVPSRIRAKSFSVFTAVNWGSNLFIGLFTLTTIDAMGAWLLPHSETEKDQQKAGVAGLYAVFACTSVVAVAFCFVFVKETTGKSLEELNSPEGGGDGEVGGGSARKGLLARRMRQVGGLGEAGRALLWVEGQEGESGGEVDEAAAYLVAL